jgi:hypothetical protein
VEAKLEMRCMEVKRDQSLEHAPRGPYPSPSNPFTKMLVLTRRLSIIRLALFGGAVAALAACKTSTGPRAQLDVRTDSAFGVYAINGAPPGAPTAVHLYTGIPVRADAAFQFDVAFDLNDQGQVVVHSVGALTSGLAPTHRVGLQVMTEPFAEVTRAPTSGYKYDSTVVVSLGTTVVMESFDQLVCGFGGFFLNPIIVAKVVFDGVVPDPQNPSTRRLVGRYTVNPNCGFRSLQPGRPQD